MGTTLTGTIWGGVTFSATPATVNIPTGSMEIKRQGLIMFQQVSIE